jgi:hypothetical protein
MTEPLQAWHEFYFLLGTSAAALTGLMGVVISINPDTIAERPTSGVRAFVTPTMVFFTTAFIVSALLLVPDLSLRSLAVLLALTGIAGVAYLVWVRGHHYYVHGIEGQPPSLDAEDWIFFIGLPYLSYLLLVAAAVGIWLHARFGPPTLAFTTMLLLVIGIHNAWDLVIWLAQQKRRAS